MTDSVAYNRSELLRVLRYLEAIVVSSDRLGSRIAHLDPSQQAIHTVNFLDGFEVFRKLAEARRVLSDAFDRELGPHDMDELERELQDVELWIGLSEIP